MELSLALVMKFWTDGRDDSDRLKNVHYTWNRLKELNNRLISNGIKSSVELFDFSPEQLIPDSTHIPYPLGEYKKSEKTNIILKKYSTYSHLFMFDCDTYFDDSDVDKLIGYLKNLHDGDILTFDLGKLDMQDTIQILNGGNFDKVNSNYSFAYSGNKSNGPLSNGHSGSLGGVYIADIPLLLSIGGFNESYVGWGGEDGEVLDRLHINNKPYKKIPIRDIFPIHLCHFSDWGNNLYSKRFKDES